jgi:ABC-type polysaccharide/polyol phosphate export permease
MTDGLQTGLDNSSKSNLRPFYQEESFIKSPFKLISNLLNYKYLVKNLVNRDLNQKYNNAILGYVWTLLEPALLASVYYVLFIIIANHTEPNYPMWVLIGVIGWGMFSRILNGTVNSLTTNSGMIKQSNIPMEVYSFSLATTQLVITVISMLIVVPFMVQLEIAPSTNLWMLPVSILCLMITAWGFGLIFASANVIFPDVAHLFRFITKAGFFVSPVMWTYEMLIERAGSDSIYFDIAMLNPVVVPLTCMRHSIEGTVPSFELIHVIYAAIFPIISYIIGSIIFTKYSRGVVTRL